MRRPQEVGLCYIFTQRLLHMLQLPTRPIRLHLVALPLVCLGLERLLLTAHPRLQVMGTSPGVAEALRLIEREPPDVVLLDTDGIDVAESMAVLRSRTAHKVLV